jgi:hypothetical protein
MMASLVLLSLLAACRSEHASFCKETSEALCARCYGCDGSDAEKGKRCGVLIEGDQEHCTEILYKVCESNDEAFSREASTQCRERAKLATCEQLEHEGKPDACRRFF